MKIFPRSIRASGPLSRPGWRWASVVLPLSLLAAGCSTTTRPPAQPVRPQVLPPRVKPPLAEGVVMPGAWRFVAGPREMISSFDGIGPGEAGLVQLVCDLQSRRLSMSYPGMAGRVDLVATNATRSYSAQAQGSGRARVELSPQDPQLDALVFSRGQFTVRPTGAPALTLPARSELARVVEDCRTGR